MYIIHFSLQARQLATVLLENSQGVTFPVLRVHDSQSEIEKALPEILIHATAVFQCIDFDGLLKPLNAILRNPAELQVTQKNTLSLLLISLSPKCHTRQK